MREAVTQARLLFFATAYRKAYACFWRKPLLLGEVSAQLTERALGDHIGSPLVFINYAQNKKATLMWVAFIIFAIKLWDRP